MVAIISEPSISALGGSVTGATDVGELGRHDANARAAKIDVPSRMAEVDPAAVGGAPAGQV